MSNNSFSYLSLVGTILLINTFQPILQAIISTYILVYNKEMLLRCLLQVKKIIYVSNVLGNVELRKVTLVIIIYLFRITQGNSISVTWGNLLYQAITLPFMAISVICCKSLDVKVMSQTARGHEPEFGAWCKWNEVADAIFITTIPGGRFRTLR